MNIKENFLTPNKWSRPQLPMAEVKGIVIHWVDAAKQEAKDTWQYFEDRKYGKSGFGSAQFIIGLHGEIIQTMPLTEKAYAVGLGGFEPQPLYKSKFNESPNRHTISIECNHIDNEGRMTQVTYAALFDLCIFLLRKFNLSAKDLYLHNDITTKVCHKYFVDNKDEWQNFKLAIDNMMNKR